MEDELSPPKSSHKEELNLNFVPAIRTTYTGYGCLKSFKSYSGLPFNVVGLTKQFSYLTKDHILDAGFEPTTFGS